ncbi:MAG: carbohydrate ABC transporter substrate-binding protein [Lachnospiraceae bacterium]|nr:carbohydrate ABC transporter substrate-binding protein [Lachnospiraceae bacterium]
MRYLKLLSTFLVAGCLLMGCGNNKEETEVGVYYLNFKPEAADIWEEIAEEYEEETGVEVKILTAANGNYEQTLKSEIAKRDAPTLFQINGPVGYETWKNYCEDLSDTNLYSWLIDKDMAVQDGSKVYAIPYVVEGYGIIYNDEIMYQYFNHPAKTTTFTSMEEVNNYEKLKLVVEDMTRLKGQLGIQGVFASTSFAAGEDWRWQTHLANLPIYYEFKDKGVSDTDILDFTYAGNYKNIFDLYLNNSCTDKSQLVKKKTDDSMREFALGQCAMVQNGNWGWGQIASIEGNVVGKEHCKFLPIYTGVAGEETQGLCIGTENYICVNSMATEEEKEAAIAFMEWVYSSDIGKDYVTNQLGFISPFNTFSESESPSDPLAQEVISYMNDSSLTSVSWNFTAFPSQSFKDNLGTNLLAYCKGEQDFSAVEKFVKDRWAKEKAEQ